MKNIKPWSFCETPKEKCIMNYCDENGCQNRKRNLVNEENGCQNRKRNLVNEEPIKKDIDLACVSKTK
jgi:hypothetical protein